MKKNILISLLSAFIILMAITQGSSQCCNTGCTSGCHPNTGTAAITHTPQCYGDVYEITVSGVSDNYGSVPYTFTANPGQTYQFDFCSDCWEHDSYQICCTGYYDYNSWCYYGNGYYYYCWICTSECTTCYEYWVDPDCHTVTIDVPPLPPCNITVSATSSPASGYSCYDGIITATTNTDDCTNNYDIYIDNWGWLGTTTPSGQSVSGGGFPAGTYTVHAYTTYGCEAVTTVTVNQPSCQIPFNASGTSSTDYNCNDGTLTFSGSTNSCSGWQLFIGADNGYFSATPSYYNTYYPDSFTTLTFTNLPPGTYTLYGQEASGGCQSTVASVIITEPQCHISGSTIVNHSSNYCPTGSIQLTASVSNCSFWYADLTFVNQSAIVGSASGYNGDSYTFNSLLPGHYSILLYDYYGNCGQTFSVNVNPSCIINGSILSASNGAITVNATTNDCYGYHVQLSGPATPDGYQLSGSSITFSGLPNGSYTVTFKSINSENNNLTSCTHTLTTQLVCSYPSAVITPQGSVSICSGNNVTLTANGGAGLTYQWKKGNAPIQNATGQTYTTGISGSYKVVVTNSQGCSKTSATTFVNVNSLPAASITAQSATTFCSGGSVVLQANSGTGLSYKWKKNNVEIPFQTSQSYTALQSGVYKVVVTNSNGCSKTSAVITVTVNPIPQASVTPQSSTTFCSGGSVLLQANIATGLTYQWQKVNTNIPNQTNNSYTATSAGSYKVIVTNAQGCSAISNIITVTVNPLPAATVTPQGPIIFCPGNNVVLQANSGMGLTYQWKKGSTNINGQTSQNYTASTPGSYKVKVTSAQGCNRTSSAVTIDTFPSPNATITPSGPIAFCTGDSVVLQVDTASALIYQWKKANVNIPGAVNYNYTAKTAGVYKVVVTDTSNGCSKTSPVITVTVNCREGVIISGYIYMELFPNPSNGKVTLKINTGKNLMCELIIMEVTGREVMHKSIDAKEGANEHVLNLSHFDKGIYLIMVKTSSGESVNRIVLQ